MPRLCIIGQNRCQDLNDLNRLRDSLPSPDLVFLFRKTLDLHGYISGDQETAEPVVLP